MSFPEDVFIVIALDFERLLLKVNKPTILASPLALHAFETWQRMKK
jgi:hypothetical protein